jgi:membrane protease subunit (stomatin/prohibitin family)
MSRRTKFSALKVHITEKKIFVDAIGMIKEVMPIEGVTQRLSPTFFNMLSCVWSVTIDGVWISNWNSYNS